MKLKELRKKFHITQKEAASTLGVPYRTYVRYEELEGYEDSYKYKKIYEDLEKAFKIDETHGILSIEEIKTIVLSILEEYHISFCYLFGSYARKEATPLSDVDLLIDTDITGIEFFKLIEKLREALSKKVDLLRLADLRSDNPIVLEILKDGIRLI